MDLEQLRRHHLELLKKFIIRYDFDHQEYSWKQVKIFPGKLKVLLPLLRILPRNWTFAELVSPPDLESRRFGRDWPLTAESMIGLLRMNQLHESLDVIRNENIPGDIVETGIWRGGTVIFAASYLSVYDMEDRKVFGCDSFEGLPEPDPKFPIDSNDIHSTIDFLRVSLPEVEHNLRKYLVDSGRVKLVKGWFEQTLPTLPVNKISILRLDGDMYSSTIDALNALYAKVSVGGIVIIDDYCLEGAKMAVHDFFNTKLPEIYDIDGTGAYFRKI
jgi:O-methyltransferase